jgi:hypothetical protein
LWRCCNTSNIAVSFFLHFVFGGTGVWTQALHLLGRHSTTWIMHPVPNIALFAQDYFGYLGTFIWIFGFFFSTSVKNAIGILMGIELNLQITFGNMAIFIILILLIHKHRRSLFLYIFWGYCKWDCFSYFFLSMFGIGI